MKLLWVLVFVLAIVGVGSAADIDWGLAVLLLAVLLLGVYMSYRES